MIDIKWDDNRQTLIIEDRQGSYPGMRTILKINAIRMKKNGTCGYPFPLVYEGKKIIVDFSIV